MPIGGRPALSRTLHPGAAGPAGPPGDPGAPGAPGAPGLAGNESPPTGGWTTGKYNNTTSGSFINTVAGTLYATPIVVNADLNVDEIIFASTFGNGNAVMGIYSAGSGTTVDGDTVIYPTTKVVQVTAFSMSGATARYAKAITTTTLPAGVSFLVVQTSSPTAIDTTNFHLFNIGCQDNSPPYGIVSLFATGTYNATLPTSYPANASAVRDDTGSVAYRLMVQVA